MKYHEAFDVLDNSLGNSIDDLPYDETVTDRVDCTLSDSEEIGTTRNISVGDKIEVFWPLDDQYYPGKIELYDRKSGKYGVTYGDGDTEKLDNAKEVYRPLLSNQVSISNISDIQTEVLEAYFKMFSQKDFLLHHAEGLPSHPLWNAYKDEEQKFMKTVREIPINKVPKNSIIMTGHVIYKVKGNDDGSLKMKARIAPHGNKGKDRFNLKTDSSQCSPTGIRILTSIATIMKYPISRIDF